MGGEMHVRSTTAARCMGAGSTTAKTPPRPCSAVSSANRGAYTRLTSHEIARVRHPHSALSGLVLLSLQTHTLLQPHSKTTTVSVKTSHVIANIHHPIMTRSAKDMRFLLGSHKHQHHHHNA